MLCICLFDQVVSADTSGGVRVWSIETGRLISCWSTHGVVKDGAEPRPSQQLTAICFDDGGRRIITGTHSGRRLQVRPGPPRERACVCVCVCVYACVFVCLCVCVCWQQQYLALPHRRPPRRTCTRSQMWNFSNGCLLKEFGKSAQEEVLAESRHVPWSEANLVALARTRPRLGNAAERVLPSVMDAGIGSRARAGGGAGGGGGGGGGGTATSESDEDGGGGVDSFATPRSEDYKRTLMEVSTVDDDNVFGVAGGGAAGAAAAVVLEKNCSEVTTIDYCTLESLRMPGRAPVQARMVASVGWDRKIYVWRDDPSLDGTVGFYAQIPEGAECAHKGDILCLAFCPPNYIATGSVDGLARLWGLNSRTMSAEFNVGSPVQCMIYVARLRLLALSGANNMVCFINVKGGVAHDEVASGHAGGVTVIACDKSAEFMVTGDSNGYITVRLRPQSIIPLLCACACGINGTNTFSMF